MITKIADIKPLIALGRKSSATVLDELRLLAASDQWQTREVAATALVEIGRKNPAAIVRVALRWAANKDANVRRAASEWLRGIAKADPESVWPVLDRLCRDSSLYVKKSVANVLRNASGKHPDQVLARCERWRAVNDPNTSWIVKDGLRKLRVSHGTAVDAVMTKGRATM